MADYDAVDAAYIFAGLWRLHNASAYGKRRLRGQGELEEMGAIWECSQKAAQAITRLVHPDEYDRLAVFCYECLDRESTLIPMLWEDSCRNPDTVVEAWMKREGIKSAWIFAEVKSGTVTEI